MDKLRLLLACCVVGGLIAASVLPVLLSWSLLGMYSLAMVALAGVVRLPW